MESGLQREDLAEGVETGSTAFDQQCGSCRSSGPSCFATYHAASLESLTLRSEDGRSIGGKSVSTRLSLVMPAFSEGGGLGRGLERLRATDTRDGALTA